MKKTTIQLSILALALGNTLTAHAKFTDEDKIAEYALYPIKILKQKNVINGNADGSFRPDASVNRAEFCKILVNATGVQTYIPAISTFPDVEPGDWFYEYVETAKYYGWVKGYPDGSFRPGGPINRAEVSKILANAFHFEATESPSHTNWYDKYIRVLKNKALLPHNVDGDEFGPSTKPTRAEISEQIYRFMINTGKLSSFDLKLKEEPIVVETPEEKTPEEDEKEQVFEFQKEEHPDETPPPPPTPNPPAPNTTETPVAVEVQIKPTPTSQSAGALSIAKKKGLPLKLTVKKDHKNLSVLSLKFSATDGSIRLGGLQFRRIGRGDYTAFSQAWVAIDDERISAKVEVTDDLLAINLPEIVTIPSGATKEINLYVDLSGKGAVGDSSRFVLYLPSWISANTNAKIGFFPFGGIDVEIK